MWETRVWSLGWEDPLEKGKATYSSILAWRIPWGPWGYMEKSMGSQRVRHYWVIFTFTFTDVFGVTKGGLPWTDDWEFFVKLNSPVDFGGKSRNVDNGVQFKPFSETNWCLWLYIIHTFPPLNDGRNAFFKNIYMKLEKTYMWKLKKHKMTAFLNKEL